MQPNHLLRAMADDHRREGIIDAEGFHHGRLVEAAAPPDRTIRFVRRLAGTRRVRLAQAIAGTPVPAVGPRS